MEPQPVVTVFLEYKNQILLLKRSDSVRTYPGLWHGVSGTIKTSAEGQARVELSEELGLHQTDVELLHRGEPLPVNDIENQLYFTVHPFLFHIKNPERIQLNWENSEAKLVSPNELDDYATVPLLGESLRQVFPAPYPGNRIEEALLDIRTDLVSGSAQIAARATSVLKTAGVFYRTTTSAGWLEHLQRLAVRIMGLRPSMAAVAHQLICFLEILQSQVGSGESLIDLREQCFRIEERFQARARQEIDHISTALNELLASAESVLVYSYSSTVVSALLASELPLKRVFVTESRPGMEGRRTAQAMARAGYAVEYLIDAAVAHFIDEIDAILVGADTICADGSVVNKMGTQMLGLIAQNAGKPMYVIADSGKLQLLASDRHPELEEKDPDEVYIGAPPGVAPRNIYFDLTPAELVTLFVTERGCLKPAELAELGYARRNELQQKFPDLVSA